MEQVALLAQQNTLPEPTLDISLLSYNATTVPTTVAAAAASAPPPSLSYGQTASSSSGSAGTGSSPSALRNAVATDDPWRFGGAYPGGDGGGGGGMGGGMGGGVNGGAPSSVAGTGLPSGWWKRQEKVSVQFGGQLGFVLNRYIVYGIITEVRVHKHKIMRSPLRLLCGITPLTPPLFRLAWWNCATAVL